MTRIFLLTLCLSALLFCAPSRALEYYVATDGSENGNGSAQSPWPNIRHALGQVSAGDTILVRDGVYTGHISTSAAFDDWVTIRAEHPYRAKLTNVGGGNGVFFIYTQGPARIIIESFVISNSDPGYVCADRESYYLIHFQDAQELILRDNIIFGNNTPGTCNELLKVNRSEVGQYPKNITVQGNVFYDHANSGGADMIDSVRPGEIDIVENIFFARGAEYAQSFITLKREVVASEEGIQPRSPRYQVARNVFLNWDGKTDQAFVQLGEDGHAQVMITDALIENNLMIGNSTRDKAGPIQLKGPRQVTVRANTIVGDHPGGAYGARIGTEGDNPQVRDIFFYNNIWSDPTGSMGDRFLNTFNDVDLSSIELDHNLFYNAGNPLPTQESPAPADDPGLIIGDPLLETDQAGIILPIWDGNQHRFQSGSTTIRDEFERLVYTYGAIAQGSPAIGAADPVNMPAVDILGRQRDLEPDVGAYEFGDSQPDAGTDAGSDDAGEEDAGEDAAGADDSGQVADDGGVPGDEGTSPGDEGNSSGDEELTGKVEGCGCSPPGRRAHFFGLFMLLTLLAGVSRRPL